MGVVSKGLRNFAPNATTISTLGDFEKGDTLYVEIRDLKRFYCYSVQGFGYRAFYYRVIKGIRNVFVAGNKVSRVVQPKRDLSRLHVGRDFNLRTDRSINNFSITFRSRIKLPRLSSAVESFHRGWQSKMSCLYFRKSRHFFHRDILRRECTGNDAKRKHERTRRRTERTKAQWR